VQDVLATVVGGRAVVCKARSALLVVERLCTEQAGVAGASALLVEVGRSMAGAHPFNELTTLAALRSGFVAGKQKDLLDLERVLGSHGTTPWQRLELEPTADGPTVRTAAMTSLGRWQRLAENPFTKHDLSVAARVAIRTLEEIINVSDSA